MCLNHDANVDSGQYLHTVTLVGLFGVAAQLSDLPVQVGVPGPQLETVEWLNVEVRTFNLQITGKKEDSVSEGASDERSIIINRDNRNYLRINSWKTPDDNIKRYFG